MSDTNPPLHTEIQRPFRRFLEEYEPLRPGETILLAWWQHTDGEAVRAFSRLECEGDRISRMRTYFHTPEAVEEVCRELGLPYRTSGYRFW